MPPSNDEGRPLPGSGAPHVDYTIASVRRLTGCPGGHAPGDEECGLDAFISERRRLRADADRRDREHADRDAHLRYWLTEILGEAS